jgi:tight adherence protein B
MNAALMVIVFLVLFALVLVAISSGYRFLESQRKQQVKGMLDVVAGKTADSQESSILVDQVETDPLASILERTDFSENLRDMIQQAGLSWKVSHLVGSMILGTVAGAIGGWILRPLGFVTLSVAVPAALLGLAPYLYLMRLRNKRLAIMEAQLPDALDFLARSMRAGHAFSISLEMLGGESPDPLGQEFRVLFNEQNLGAPIEQALGNFANRIPLMDVRMFVSSVLLQKQTGGNLSEILIRLAYVIRERFRLKGQVKAASAHGRLTALVLTVLPLVLVVALLFIAPGYLQGMVNDPDGKWMVVGAICAQVAGYFVMRKIIDIKV